MVAMQEPGAGDSVWFGNQSQGSWSRIDLKMERLRALQPECNSSLPSKWSFHCLEAISQGITDSYIFYI